jgi:DNA-binding response OmpR family regulator
LSGRKWIFSNAPPKYNRNFCKEADLFSKSFRVHLSALKKKLSVHLGSAELIKNTRNVGYFIAAEDKEND